MKHLKLFLCIAIIFLGSKTASAQDPVIENTPVKIQNTSWKGTFFVPSPQECIMTFTSDTAYLKINGESIETSTFTINGDTLTFHKVSGGSPCGMDIIGIYKMDIKDDLLSISVIADDCQARAMGFPTEPLTAIKE
ncbi:MAG: hypothetical protein ABIY35_05980 [Chitinophagaceae bacterium]